MTCHVVFLFAGVSPPGVFSQNFSSGKLCSKLYKGKLSSVAWVVPNGGEGPSYLPPFDASVAQMVRAVCRQASE